MKNNLTLHNAKAMLEAYRTASALFQLPLTEELLMQALELAIPVLEAQEAAAKYGVGFVRVKETGEPEHINPSRIIFTVLPADGEI